MSVCLKLAEETRKGRRGILLVHSLLKNEDSVEMSGTTEDSISEPEQVGQESGIWHVRVQKKKGYVLKHRRKEEIQFPLGRKRP